MANATARPWEIRADHPFEVIANPDWRAGGLFLFDSICDCDQPARSKMDSEESKANARLIVRSVNAFDSMKAALIIARKNLQFLPPDDVVEQIDAALALAESEQK